VNRALTKFESDNKTNTLATAWQWLIQWLESSGQQLSVSSQSLSIITECDIELVCILDSDISLDIALFGINNCIINANITAKFNKILVMQLYPVELCD
jgi:hypothetical protein